MRLTIFWRLMIGYLIIFLLVMMVGVYAIIQFKKFNAGTQYILNVNNLILEYDQKLADLTLSQHRFFKKYVIAKDQNLYNLFLSANEGFSTDLDSALVISDTPFKKDVIKRVQDYHTRYLVLAEEEHEFIQSKQNYLVKWYDSEKEKLVDNILSELEKLKGQVQRDTYRRMKEQGEAGDSARDVAVILASVALSSVIVISFLITRSITNPLHLLRIKTREISEGIFKSDLMISASPEISELAQAFNQMSYKLSTLEKVKSDFFSTMSHELRTPLTSIKEGIALLQEETAGPITIKQQKLLNIIAQESHRLIDLVNSSLDLSKMEAGMMTYRFEPADLVPLIDKVKVEMVPLIETKKIGFTVDIKGIVPLIKMDRERILQVFRNLIGNAVKLTPEKGQIEVSVRPVNQRIRVAVRDTGPGIPNEHLLTIFNKFHQVSPQKVYQIKGSGIGLAIVKHIIQSHGGEVWAESILGQGSTFYFWLPA